MKIEKEFRDDHQVKLTVVMDADPFERAKRRAARKIAKRIKIPGFRPGKAPYGVILRTVGEGQVVENALELLIEEQYPEVIKQAEIEPYGPGKLENVPELDPPTFEFIVPLDAKVELGDYKTIRIPYQIPDTSDEDVMDALNDVREQNATRESVDRPAKIGDTVFIRVSGERTDVEDDDKDAVLVEEKFSSSVIREEARDDEFPFPGFSKELIGLSAEDQKTILYTFPEDYEAEDLQGVQAQYTVSITNVQSTTLPDLDDEFANENSEFDSLDKWKADLKIKLQEQAELTYTDEYDNSVIDQIVKDSSLKYPPQMIENEANEMVRSLEYRLSQQGMTKDLYLQIRGMDEKDLQEEIKPIAEDRLRRSLILFEIAKIEDIEIDQEKIQSEAFRTFDAISSQMTPNEAKKLTQSQFIPNLMTNIAVDLTSQTTMDFLRAMAKGEPWPPEGEIIEEEKAVEQNSKQESVDEAITGAAGSDQEINEASEIDTDTAGEPERTLERPTENAEDKTTEVEDNKEEPQAEAAESEDE